MIKKAVIRLQLGYYALREARPGDLRDRGATAVEYALIVSLIAVAIVALVATLGETIAGIFTNTNNQIVNNQPGGGGNPPPPAG
ncbi:Flp family type IVb pilin [Actinocorallia sp. B10E7]|uniref:Flp family type IVb pilin n=1 Tax=Actinocorallia sp. B10E7 TaxID=3153558 RepID=UPI00325F24A4